MKLRIATYKNRVTAEQCKAYAHKHELSQREAKEALEDVSHDILEYWHPNGYWIEVPRETIYRNEP